MKISEYARKYELTHNHTLNGSICRGATEIQFKYGELSDVKSKITDLHGYTISQHVVEIETVRPVVFALGDKVRLADGRYGKVAKTETKLLQPNQLLFVSYAKADKKTRITIQFV